MLLFKSWSLFDIKRRLMSQQAAARVPSAIIAGETGDIDIRTNAKKGLNTGISMYWSSLTVLNSCRLLSIGCALLIENNITWTPFRSDLMCDISDNFPCWTACYCDNYCKKGEEESTVPKRSPITELANSMAQFVNAIANWRILYDWSIIYINWPIAFDSSIIFL